MILSSKPAIQLIRKSFPLPLLDIKRKSDFTFDYTFEDFEIVNYQAHPSLNISIAV